MNRRCGLKRIITTTTMFNTNTSIQLVSSLLPFSSALSLSLSLLFFPSKIVTHNDARTLSLLQSRRLVRFVSYLHNYNHILVRHLQYGNYLRHLAAIISVIMENNFNHNSPLQILISVVMVVVSRKTKYQALSVTLIVVNNDRVTSLTVYRFVGIVLLLYRKFSFFFFVSFSSSSFSPSVKIL